MRRYKYLFEQAQGLEAWEGQWKNQPEDESRFGPLSHTDGTTVLHDGGGTLTPSPVKDLLEGGGTTFSCYPLGVRNDRFRSWLV